MKGIKDSAYAGERKFTVLPNISFSHNFWFNGAIVYSIFPAFIGFSYKLINKLNSCSEFKQYAMIMIMQASNHLQNSAFKLFIELSCFHYFSYFKTSSKFYFSLSNFSENSLWTLFPVAFHRNDLEPRIRGEGLLINPQEIEHFSQQYWKQEKSSFNFALKQSTNINTQIVLKIFI